MDIDVKELEEFLVWKLGRAVELKHLASVPGKSVFRLPGEDGHTDTFVKCASMDDCRRSWHFLSVSALPFVPRAKFLYLWHGVGVMGLEWKEKGRRVAPEEMTATQAKNLLEAHERLLAEMREKLGGDEEALKPLPDAGGFYETVAGYVRRHPLAGRFIASLAGIPETERTYDRASVTPIVNDFHCDNYAFDGDEVSAVYDFDWMRLGTACEDLTYAFARRIRKARLSRRARRRAADLFVEVVRSSPYPPQEWRRAVNICRLDAAAKRLRSHPNSALVALDVLRRDKPLRELVERI